MDKNPDTSKFVGWGRGWLRKKAGREDYHIYPAKPKHCYFDDLLLSNWISDNQGWGISYVKFCNLFCFLEDLQVLFNFSILRQEWKRTKVCYLAHNDLLCLTSWVASALQMKTALAENCADLYQMNTWSAVLKMKWYCNKVMPLKHPQIKSQVVQTTAAIPWQQQWPVKKTAMIFITNAVQLWPWHLIYKPYFVHHRTVWGWIEVEQLPTPCL